MLFTDILKKALIDIENMFDDEGLEFFKKCKYNELYNYHFSLGMAIRNRILTTDSELYEIFMKSGITHKDDMSFLLINIFYIYIKSKKP